MNNIIANIKKPYIIGSMILLVVIGGYVIYEHEHGPEAKYQKGLHYYKDGSYKKAARLFKEAAKQGYAPAEEKLGYMYGRGQGVSQDRYEAVHWFKKAAKQGNAKRRILSWNDVPSWFRRITSFQERCILVKKIC